QRRDIDDPKTIADFAAAAGDPQRLKMLYLLTWADMRAVGPGVLTPWQATILHELYRRSLARLTGGRRQPPSRTQLTERPRPAGRRRGDLGAGGQGAPGDDVRALSGDDRRPADGRAPEHAPAAQHHLGRDRAVSPSRPWLVRLGRSHPRSARALLADRRHPRLAGREHHLRPDPHARRRDR